MHRTWTTLTLVALSATLTAHAQTSNPVLVTADLTRPQAAAFFDRMHPRVYHATESWAVIELTAPQVELARRAGHPVAVIDDMPGAGGYHITARKQAQARRADVSGADVLLERDGLVITRGKPSAAPGIDARGLSSVPMRPQAIALDNGAVTGSPKFPPATDSLIASIVARVNPDTVRWFIQHLQDFRTRYAFASNRDSVAEWIKAQFVRMGYASAARDAFPYGGTLQTNVIATLAGSGASDQMIVFGGHHDSNSPNPYLVAPGADDNASGTAAALETARILKESGYTPEVTIKFATFAAEEVGLVGSEVDAARSTAAGTRIKLMINHDMIANNSGSHIGRPVDVYYYTGSEAWRELGKQTTDQFTSLTGRTGGMNSAGSDSYSYWREGYPAIYFFETVFSPVYHSAADTIGNINIDYCAEVIRASAATLLRADVMPNDVRALDVADRGDGHSLRAWWRPGDADPASCYRFFIGTSSGAYDSSVTVADTSVTISGLATGTRYYLAVATVDLQGNESMVREKSAVPRLAPLAPADFRATSDASTISLQWEPNLELDILGYNVYFSETPGELGQLKNSAVLLTTTYTDLTAQPHAYYYYTVRAIDSLFNEGAPSPQLRARRVTLDQGVLMVDESADNIGAPGNPTDRQVDEFYDALLAGYQVTQYDVQAQGGVVLGDMGAHSSVVWFADDLTDLDAPRAAREEIRKYIELGGKFFYAGLRPTRAFTGNSAVGLTFGPGDFMWDVLGIRANDLRPFARFSGAVGVADAYAPVSVDSAKALLTDGFHIRNVEAILPSPGARAIYAYDSGYDTSSALGALKGKPVGVEWITPAHASVVVSFPLYYMNAAEARSLVQYVLGSRFNEVTGAGEPGGSIPADFALEQNYPNPFNPATSIRFNLPDQRWVTLSVFDMLGRQVATLVNEPMAPGVHVVEFDAAGLSSGMYVYRLAAGSFAQAMRMVLVR